jgi:hypothetical protein
MIGTRFGRLSITGLAPSSGGKRRWQCICDCGKVTTPFAWKLLAGKARSCGCLKVEELNTRQGHELHGMRGSAEYRLWARLKTICHDPNSRSFAGYGGQGVRVDPRWFSSFSAFYEDVGPRPSPDHRLVRYDDTGDFAPANCRWVRLPRPRRRSAAHLLDGVDDQE